MNISAGEPMLAGTVKPITVTVKTAKELSGLGQSKIWELIGDGTLEIVHVGRRALITYRSLEALLAPIPVLEPSSAPRSSEQAMGPPNTARRDTARSVDLHRGVIPAAEAERPLSEDS